VEFQAPSWATSQLQFKHVSTSLGHSRGDIELKGVPAAYPLDTYPLAMKTGGEEGLNQLHHHAVYGS